MLVKHETHVYHPHASFRGGGEVGLVAPGAPGRRAGRGGPAPTGRDQNDCASQEFCMLSAQ